MKAGKVSFSPFLWLLTLTLILLGRQSQTQKPPTRAEDSPGFGLLEESRQLSAAKKYSEGFNKALEASTLLRTSASWTLVGDCYEQAYNCSRKCDSTAIYQRLMQELVDASKEISGKKDVPAITQAIIWGRIGSVHHTFGDYNEAIVHYERAIPFADQAADTSLMLKLYGSAAGVIWGQGDDFRAINYYEKALSLAIAKQDTVRMATILTNMGNAWRTLDPPKSIPIYLRALALAPEESAPHMLLSKAYLEAQKDFPKAMQMAKTALFFATNDKEKTDALHQLGRVFHEMKQYPQALSYYNQAYTLGEKSYGKKHPECVKIHAFIGKTLLAQRNFAQAMLAFNQTLEDLLPLFKPASADQNPTEPELTTTSWWILEALNGKAETYRQKFHQGNNREDLTRSLACAELAQFYQNKLKLRFGEDESKYAISSQFVSSAETALHSAFLLYGLTGSQAFVQRAFRISEQTKAVVLAEALYKKEMKQVANVPPGLLEQERRMQEQTAYFEQKLLEAEAIGSANVYKDSLFQARRQLEQQEQQIEANYPAYGEALFSYRTDTPPDSVRQHLPDDAAMVEYFLGDSSLFTFLITKDTFWVQEQRLPANFDQTATQFLRTVKDWHFVSDSSALASTVFLEKSHHLYQWLLEKPLAATSAKRLFIVPDGKLSLLPFELLLTRSYQGQWIDRDVPFLLKERTVSYRFSCRSQAKKTTTPKDGWGGFGLEYNNTPSKEEGNQSESRGTRDFGPLPFADDEIMAINQVLGGAFWLNQDATRENFLKNAEHYGILHLAMHGMVDERNPLRSRLLFSNSVAGSDPFVYASDLYNLQLEAGLSVLSACQSGTGAWKKGEGVLSLARAFAFAGCPSMVMSLWNVSDQSTSELMVSFYEQLKAGATKDDALRSAKLQYLQTVSPEYSKPIYWAAFVPIGEMNSLPAPYFNSGGGLKSLLMWGALLVLLVLVGRRFLLRKG